MTTVRDWCEASPLLVDALYAREAERWGGTLGWDTTATWRAVEMGRRIGTVTGFVALDDDGAVVGWCFGLPDRDTFQVGGFCANAPAVTETLIDRLVRSPAGRLATGWIWFGWFDAPGLPEALARRGGRMWHYHYMARDLGEVRGPRVSSADDSLGLRTFQDADAALVPALLASAYAGADETRPFAPEGRIVEWCEYVSRLLYEQGCGRFDQQGSLVVRRDEDRLDGVAVVSRLSDDTAHLAQLAVRPELRGCGVGARLLAAAEVRAADSGCRQLTLLVHEGSDAARRLYARAGYADRARFTFARWAQSQPWTSSSEALPTGGVSTRR